MNASYVLNPLRARRSNVFWFQVASERALEIDNLRVIEAIEDRLSGRRSARSRTLVEQLGGAFPAAAEGQRRRTVDALIENGVLMPRKRARAFPKRVLAPILDRVLAELDRQRRMSYRAGRAGKEGNLLWEPSIFGPLSLDRQVFYSTLLICAAERDYPFVLRYDSPSRLKVRITKIDTETEFDSRFRYVPEDPRAEGLVETKSYANYLCQLAGLPVPRQHLCSSVLAGCRAAKALGYPVVVKPNLGHDGIDVHPHIDSEAHLRGVMRGLLPKWKSRGGMVLEQHVFGTRYRFTVVDSEIVEVRAAYPPAVVGDGRSSLRALVRRENRLRKSTYTRADGGAGIRLDDRVRERLRRRGLTPKSILPRGETLQLHYTLNRSAGVWSQATALDHVHPQVRAMAVRAVQLFGLRVGGVDYIAPTIEDSPAACGGKICEVQAHPAVIPGDLDYGEFVGKVLDCAMSRPRSSTLHRDH